jgi:N-acetylmuramoyl-L-alanine amidase
MKLLRTLKTLLLINFFLLTFTVFANGVERITVGVDRNYYKLFLVLSKPEWVKVIKDTKRDLIVLKLRNSVRFFKSLWSVSIKGDRGLITVLVKNPKLSVVDAKVITRGRFVYIFIPFKRKFAKFVVVIDPGHGGKDPGAIYGGYREKWINLAIAKKLYRYLKADGRFKVYMTRYGDRFVSLAGRQKFAAKVKADLFISIHANADPKNPSARGVEFFVLSDRGKLQKLRDLSSHPGAAMDFFSKELVYNRSLREKVIKSTLEITQDEGEELAQLLCEEWKERLGRYIPCRGIYRRAFAVLKVPGIPTVLVEVGFMSNGRDLKFITSPRFQWSIAKTLYLGILDFFDLKPPKGI